MESYLTLRKRKNTTVDRWNMMEILDSQASMIWEETWTSIWATQMEAPANSSLMGETWVHRESILTRSSRCFSIKEEMKILADSAWASQEWEEWTKEIAIKRREIIPKLREVPSPTSQVSLDSVASEDSARIPISIFHDITLLLSSLISFEIVKTDLFWISEYISFIINMNVKSDHTLPKYFLSKLRSP